MRKVIEENEEKEKERKGLARTMERGGDRADKKEKGRKRSKKL